MEGGQCRIDRHLMGGDGFQRGSMTLGFTGATRLGGRYPLLGIGDRRTNRQRRSRGPGAARRARRPKQVAGTGHCGQARLLRDELKRRCQIGNHDDPVEQRREASA